jgi:hypothetical protein
MSGVAGCKGRRRAPSGKAYYCMGSNRRNKLRERVGLSRSLWRSVNWWSQRIRWLCKMLLRDGGDSSLLRWRLMWSVTVVGVC